MQTHITELSEKQMIELAKMTANIVTDNLTKEKKQFKQRSYHNAKELLKNYHKLKKHCTMSYEQFEEDKDRFWNHGYLDIDALMQNKAKTIKMMNHFDKCLVAYKEICNQSKKTEESRRYEILNMRYLQSPIKSLELIADRYDVDRRTVGRSVDEGIKDLSVLLFGIDFINEL